MITTGKYVITFTGQGIIRLPRAGIFQTGTRAVVDETVARIATAHGCFAVVSLDAPAVPMPIPVPQSAPAPVPVVPEPVAAVAAAPAAPAAPLEDRTRRPTRRSQAIRAVPDPTGRAR
jgi:hypothetical protein